MTWRKHPMWKGFYVCILSILFASSGINCFTSKIASKFANVEPKLWPSATSMYPVKTSIMLFPLPNTIRRSHVKLQPVVPPPINENIRADPVRVIAPKVGGARGEEEMLGIYPLDEALMKAEAMELDLVMINEKGDPPVCKIIDYGKYKYSLARKKRENVKKQVKGGLKEVKMSYKIDIHDFNVRVRAAKKFISDGDRVKVLVQFKGREMQHRELGYQVLARFLEPISDTAMVESAAKVEGRSMFMLIAPKKIEKK